MEAFANSSDIRVALCAAPANNPQATFKFTFNNMGNTPDLLVGPGTVSNVCSGPDFDNVVAPQGTNMLSILGGGNLAFHKREGVAFPLCSTIEEGECVVVRFWASKPPQCAGDFLAFIEFMPNPPVSGQIVYDNPGNVSTQTQVAITHNLPQFGQYQVTITRPANSPAWNYLLFSVYRTHSPIGRAVFDDIQVIRPIPVFTYTADCQEVTFAFTAHCDDVVEHLREFGDGTTSTLPNPTHHYLQPGTYTVTHTISLTCNGTEHNYVSQQELIVEDCPELFDCACEMGININAEGGLPVSALGLNSLDLSQHGGIVGKVDVPKQHRCRCPVRPVGDPDRAVHRAKSHTGGHPAQPLRARPRGPLHTRHGRRHFRRQRVVHAFHRQRV
ncbi:MAG: PKD domain-containing protein [Saprospiraceae bacterium]